MQATSVTAITWATFAGGVGAAALWDLRSRRVPNRLSLAIAATGLACGAANGAWAASLLGLAVGLGVLVLPFARGWLGAGDVKLLAAVGAWLGPERTVYCALASAVLGGVLALVFLLRLGPEHRRAVATNLRLAFYTRAVPTVEERPARTCPPYAVAIGAGALTVALLFGGPGVTS